jgi:hypothetical protein
MGAGGAGSLTYIPCASKKACATWITLALEQYVSYGLPAEWYATWQDDSLKAGAVAYRSFGAWYVANPINSQKYDICNTTACQVYDPFDKPSSSYSRSAVQATASVVLSQDGVTIFFAEYAADGNGFACPDGETGEPASNWPCIADPIAAGTSQPHVHGRGMGQWPSHWWAAGYNSWTGARTTPACWQCILDHYYNDNGNSTGAGTGLRTSFLYQPVIPGYGPSPDGYIAFTPVYEVPTLYGSPAHGVHRTRPAQAFGGCFARGPSDLYTLWLDGTNLFDVNPNQSQCSADPSWDPTQQQIAYNPFRWEIRIIPASGGSMSPLDVGSEDQISGAAWSRQNMIAYYDLTQGGLYSVPAAGGPGIVDRR